MWYNQGIFVKKVSYLGDGDGAGIRYIINSKKQMRVNMAREEILVNCPIYEKAEKKAKELLIKMLECAEDASKYEAAIIELIRNETGSIFYDKFKNKKIFTLINNQKVSLNELKIAKEIGIITPHSTMKKIYKLMTNEKRLVIQTKVSNLSDLLKKKGFNNLVTPGKVLSEYKKEFSLNKGYTVLTPDEEKRWNKICLIFETIKKTSNSGIYGMGQHTNESLDITNNSKMEEITNLNGRILFPKKELTKSLIESVLRILFECSKTEEMHESGLSLEEYYHKKENAVFYDVIHSNQGMNKLNKLRDSGIVPENLVYKQDAQSAIRLFILLERILSEDFIKMVIKDDT